MKTKIHGNVFIATSLDGFIADKQGKIDFLNEYPDPENEDMGYDSFMSSIDALLMGRKTFETVLGFGIAWPYKKPVYIWSSTIKEIPTSLPENVTLVKGTAIDICNEMKTKGFHNLYIDGGETIQSFLREDLIETMIITTIPILLGEGIPLFGNLPDFMQFVCTETKLFSNGIVQQKYTRKQSS